MKKNIVGLSFAAMSLVAVSCADGVGTDSPGMEMSGMSVYMEDAGFQGKITSVRELEVGDKVGIFAVVDGEIVDGYDNLCLIAVSDGEGGLELIPSKVDMEYPAKAAFFAYSPWCESLKTMDAVDVSAKDAEGFFAPMIEKWTPGEDQNSIDAMAESDLIVGSGTATEDCLFFLMKHQMAVISFEFPVKGYNFCNDEIQIPDYVMESCSGVQFEGIVPMETGLMTYMCLINPVRVSEVSGTYTDNGGNGRDWSVKITVGAGQSQECSIDGGKSMTEHMLQVGDFFLSDGSLLSRDADAGTVGSSDVVGVVFSVDQSRISNADRECLGGAAHALVLSTRKMTGDNSGYFKWFDKNGEFDRDETGIGIPEIFVYGDVEATFLMADADINGYSYNIAVRTRRSADYLAGYYPVFSAPEDFSHELGHLEPGTKTTGWYLPSNGQWFDIIRGLAGVDLSLNGSFTQSNHDFFWSGCGNVIDMMNAAFEKVADDSKDVFEAGSPYWTSSVASSQSARQISFNNDGYVNCRWSRKDLGYAARMILAF